VIRFQAFACLALGKSNRFLRRVYDMPDTHFVFRTHIQDSYSGLIQYPCLRENAVSEVDA